MARSNSPTAAGVARLRDQALGKISDETVRADVADVFGVVEKHWLDAEALAKTTRELAEAKGEHRPRERGFDRFIGYLQTPPFYVFFGLGLIIAAYVCTERSYNTTLNFLVVILGIAVLLYGTGSQAAATWGIDTSQAKMLLDAHLKSSGGDKNSEMLKQLRATLDKPSSGTLGNIAIAGGAAVIAAFFGWGVTYLQPDIRQALRDWDRYSVVFVKLCYDGTGCNQSGSSHRAQSGGVSADTEAQILASLSLFSQTGQRAYGRLQGGELQFVIFDQEVGEHGELVIPKTRVSGPTGKTPIYYSMDGDYRFSLASLRDTDNKGKCLEPADSTPQKPCLVSFADVDSRQSGGVPYYTVNIKVDAGVDTPKTTTVADDGTPIDINSVGSPG